MNEATSAEAAPPALLIEDVSHAFGPRKALVAVNVSIAPGDFCVLLGLNGAGKTTLFSLVTRLYNNTAGTIRVLGHDLRRAPGQALGRLGVVFQQRTLDLDLSIMQNLIYHGALHGLPAAEVKRRAEAELALVGLSDRAGDKVRRLSGGQMRRVEIARALLHRPRLLLLDEPTVGLDIDSRQAIQDRVRALCGDERLAVLWATHLIDEVLPDSRVVVLHQGKVLASGTRDQVTSETGASDIRDAFSLLTREPRAAGNAA